MTQRSAQWSVRGALTLFLILLACALTFGGCGAIGGALMFTGMTISCGPIPLSPDQCGGGWLRSLLPEELRRPVPVMLPLEFDDRATRAGVMTRRMYQGRPVLLPTWLAVRPGPSVIQEP